MKKVLFLIMVFACSSLSGCCARLGMSFNAGIIRSYGYNGYYYQNNQRRRRVIPIRRPQNRYDNERRENYHNEY